MIDAESGKRSKRYYTKHGLTTIKKAVRVLGGRAIANVTEMNGKEGLRIWTRIDI